MKKNRRDFIKLTGITGLGLTAGGLMKNYASQFNYDDPNLAQDIISHEKEYTQHFNMSGFAAPKISTARIGIIGLGQRGPSHVKIMNRIDGFTGLA